MCNIHTKRSRSLFTCEDRELRIAPDANREPSLLETPRSFLNNPFDLAVKRKVAEARVGGTETFLEQRHVHDHDRLQTFTFVKNVVRDVAEGRESGEDHSEELRAFSESGFGNFVQLRQVREGNTLKGRASAERARTDVAEGWESGEGHGGELSACTERTAVNALEQRQVHKADHLKRLTAEEKPIARYGVGMEVQNLFRKGADIHRKQIRPMLSSRGRFAIMTD